MQPRKSMPVPTNRVSVPCIGITSMKREATRENQLAISFVYLIMRWWWQVAFSNIVLIIVTDVGQQRRRFSGVRSFRALQFLKKIIFHFKIPNKNLNEFSAYIMSDVCHVFTCQMFNKRKQSLATSKSLSIIHLSF